MRYINLLLTLTLTRKHWKTVKNQTH